MHYNSPAFLVARLCLFLPVHLFHIPLWQFLKFEHDPFVLVMQFNICDKKKKKIHILGVSQGTTYANMNKFSKYSVDISRRIRRLSGRSGFTLQEEHVTDVHIRLYY